jgi:hypothetical protein
MWMLILGVLIGWVTVALALGLFIGRVIAQGDGHDV